MPPALRSAEGADTPFLFRVYAGTRTDELAGMGWAPSQTEAFLQMQFAAQRRSYGVQFPEARWKVILQGRAPVGGLLVSRNGAEIRLVDIALLPQYRGSGIGTALIAGLQAEAAEAGLPLRLHVDIFNRALRLYERLGFSRIGRDGLHHALEWIPGRDRNP